MIQLVRNYLKDFQEFGSLGFEIRVIREDGRGGQPTEYAILNEDQAYLLLTDSESLGFSHSKWRKHRDAPPATTNRSR